MKILGGLLKPDAGTMHVNGRDVTGWSTPDAIKADIIAGKIKVPTTR
jgi:simple sugar transport system ATP-binding protein